MENKQRQWALDAIELEWQQIAARLSELRLTGPESSPEIRKLLKRQARLEYLSSEFYGKGKDEPSS